MIGESIEEFADAAVEHEAVDAVIDDESLDQSGEPEALEDLDGLDEAAPQQPNVLEAEQGPSQGALPLDVKTGDPRVDEAVSLLRDLDRLPVSDHAEVFTQVHRDLQDALLTLDQG